MARKIGELLVSEGLLTRKQLEEALKCQVIFGGRLGTNLVEMGIIEESRITLLASQANLICMVCNGRLGLSHKLAESILVQELPKETTADAAC